MEARRNLIINGIVFRPCLQCGTKPIFTLSAQSNGNVSRVICPNCKRGMSYAYDPEPDNDLNDTGLRMLAERWNHEKLERRPFPSEKPEPHKTARYRLDISLKDNMIAFVGGNPGALACLNQLSGYVSLRQVLISLDAVGIYEEKIYMLWNDCCGRNPIEMINTLSLFNRGAFTYEEIHNNLDQTRASSFLKMYEERNGA